MVVALGPGKFYGSSLPRPRFYTDIKFNDTRVDPPVPVNDPLLSWAEEAHWSMGGLSHQRLRMQGKIEGNVQKLRKEKEGIMRKKIDRSTPVLELKEDNLGSGSDLKSPPPAPITKKKRARSMLVDEDDSDEDVEEEERGNGGARRLRRTTRRRLVRKLGDDFELVASAKGKSDDGVPVVGGTVALRTRSRRSVVVPEEEEEEAEEVGSENGGKSEIKKAENVVQRKGSVSPKGSASVGNGVRTRSSPRLKQKSS